MEVDSAFTRENKIEPIGLYTWWLIIADLFLVVIYLLFNLAVVPVFRRIFSTYGGQLPRATDLTINISALFTDYWFLSLPLVIAAVTGTRFMLIKRVSRDWIRKTILIAIALVLIVFISRGLWSLFYPMFVGVHW